MSQPRPTLTPSSEDFKRLKEEAERRILAEEANAQRSRGQTVPEGVVVKTAAAKRIDLLERTVLAKEYEIQVLQEERQCAVDQCHEALLAASLAESMVKELEGKVRDLNSMQDKLKEFDALLEKLKVCEEKEKQREAEELESQQTLESERAKQEQLTVQLEEFKTALATTTQRLSRVELKYEKLKRRYENKKSKIEQQPHEDGVVLTEVEELKQENNKLKETLEQEQKLRASQEQSLSRLRLRQNLRIEVKVQRVIDTKFTPFGLYISNDSNVYVGNLRHSQSTVIAYRMSDGKKVKKITLGKMDDGVGIRGIGLNQNNLMYVAFSNNTIRVYRLPDGNLVRQFGATGAGKCQFNEIHGVTIEPKSNHLYITDSCNNRVQVLNEEGEFVRNIGITGAKSQKLGFPHGVALDSKGRIIVSEYEHHRIQVFSADGTSLFCFGKKGSGSGEFNDPRGLTVDKSDNIIVCDYFNHRVQIFDSEGNFLHSFGGQGTKPGQFDKPRYAAFDSVSSAFCIATDINDHRVQILSF